jgi:hypothetical protein
MRRSVADRGGGGGDPGLLRSPEQDLADRLATGRLVVVEVVMAVDPTEERPWYVTSHLYPGLEPPGCIVGQGDQPFLVPLILSRRRGPSSPETVPSRKVGGRLHGTLSMTLS